MTFSLGMQRKLKMFLLLYVYVLDKLDSINNLGVVNKNWPEKYPRT